MKGGGLVLAGAGAGLLYLALRESQVSAVVPPPEPPGALSKDAAIMTTLPTSGDPDDITPAGFDAPGKEDGAELVSHLTPTLTPEREAQILDWVRTGRVRTSWAPLQFQHPSGLTLTLFVLARAMRVGATNSIRLSCSYQTSQDVCDLIGASMPTRLIANRHRQDSTLALDPVTEGAWVRDGTMANTYTYTDSAGTQHVGGMLDYSQILDQLVPDDTAGQIVSNEGKLWALTQQFWAQPQVRKAANYGWWTRQAPVPGQGPYQFFGTGQPTDRSIWQNIGLAHDWSHADYSQLLDVLVAKIVLLGGTRQGQCHIGTILRHPDYSSMLSDEGPLQSWKHPAFGPSEVTPEWQALLDAGLPPLVGG